MVVVTPQDKKLGAPAEDIAAGRTSLGIEFGSTRIKASLITRDGSQIASGAHTWENTVTDGHWSYPLSAIHEGLVSAYADLVADTRQRYGVVPETFASMGISAMMHGYLAFDEAGELLVPFRTWRDTTTGEASDTLTTALNQNIPLRWSVAHLYQVLLNKEEHASRIDFMTTLAGYVHWRLTGEKVLGVGDASGMFPVAADGRSFDTERLATFDELAKGTALSRPLASIMPGILRAGENAGRLTAAGAAFLDPTGTLKPGARFAPPEGDAGTGMVATNAVRARTGNVSVGTSIFLMAVQERPLKKAHRELDPVMTPSGAPVAMVHCNNGADELSHWVALFAEVGAALRAPDSGIDSVYSNLLTTALTGDAAAGGILSFNNISGEPVTNLAEGRPAIVREPGAQLNLANLMRSQIFSTFAALAIGLEVLEKEGVELDMLSAHGGVFRTRGVVQKLLAAATKTPITVAESASEGGAWGMAVLAAYADCKARGECGSLEDYLAEVIFASAESTTETPSPTDIRGFTEFLASYRRALPIQSAAIESIPSPETTGGE